LEQNDLIFIQNRIGYEFKNLDLLQQAFVRRSYSQENGGENNEVLEFIGDKVLDLFVVKFLIEKYGCMLSEYDDYDAEEEFDEFTSKKMSRNLPRSRRHWCKKTLYPKELMF
jgi:ribonuclease-3